MGSHRDECQAGIIRRGLELRLDYTLTHSCYDPLPDGSPCGTCDSCVLRARGFSEAGVPGFDVSAWYALFVPAKTPEPIISKLHADTVTALSDPTTKARLEQLGVTVIGSTPEQLRTHLKSEMDKWGVIIKEAGIKVE